MERKSEVIRKLGAGLRERLPVEADLSPDMEVLVLRLAVQELERLHYGATRRIRSLAAG
jgi:hypothetical protein